MTPPKTKVGLNGKSWVGMIVIAAGAFGGATIAVITGVKRIHTDVINPVVQQERRDDIERALEKHSEKPHLPTLSLIQQVRETFATKHDLDKLESGIQRSLERIDDKLDKLKDGR